MENTFVLDVNSPAMESAVKSLDMMLKRCLNQLMDGNFEGGEIKNGRDFNLGAWLCSECGCKNNNLGMDNRINPHIFSGSNYCPNCGARMDGGDEDAER